MVANEITSQLRVSCPLPICAEKFPGTLISEQLRHVGMIIAYCVRLKNNLESFTNAQSLTSNPENRCSVLLFRTAIASAFRWPINTTSFFPRVMPV